MVAAELWNHADCARPARGITEFRATKLFDPHVNIEFGAKYIGDKISQYNNNKTVALATHNQGPVASKQEATAPDMQTGLQEQSNQSLIDNCKEQVRIG